MATEFDVVQDPETGSWQIRENKKVIGTRERLEDAVAFARAVLLQRNQGSVTVYTPSGRTRERLDLSEQADGTKFVQAA